MCVYVCLCVSYALTCLMSKQCPGTCWLLIFFWTDATNQIKFTIRRHLLEVPGASPLFRANRVAEIAWNCFFREYTRATIYCTPPFSIGKSS